MHTSPYQFPAVALLLLALACGGDGDGAPDDLERACRQLIACEAEPVNMQRIEQCRQDLSSEYEAAATEGCADVYADLVACYAMVPLVCSMEGPGSCEAVQSALDTCLGGCAARGERNAFVDRCGTWS